MPNKYHAKRTGKYASKHEADIAANLWHLSKAKIITALQEQVRFELIKGRNGVRGVTYVADFTYVENGQLHIVDAKGFKTEVYKLKKRMMYLLMGITIEEV